jgi:hypothetical protein
MRKMQRYNIDTIPHPWCNIMISMLFEKNKVYEKNERRESFAFF